ncbi:IS1182 family transposase [Ideonella margarita]|uniref:IS1182 family transposase n=1 Tax=Ideonella margarita TaxID=2984191 RepID=A0ABU9C6Z9_9BURK
MPRYKPVDRSPRFLPVVLAEQIQPGTFEFALDHLVDNELDLSMLDARFRNDDVGASAYDPQVMLKIVLLAYSRGLVSSRSIAHACLHHVQFMAISGDSQPSYTHIAKFVRGLKDQIQPLFVQVLMTCDRLGLIGRQMFAIDGVKLPCNASKERSGTFDELAHRAARLDKAADKILALHQAQDAGGESPTALDAARQARIDELRREARATRAFVAGRKPRLSERGQELKSNITDPDSAKMATGKGVIQGYAAQAAVDSAHQVIVAAEVTGSGSEQNMLLPMIEAAAPVRAAHTLITADAGYHSSENVNALCEAGIPALLADNQMRQRDERYAEQAKHKAKGEVLHDKRKPAASPNPKVKGYFSVADFVFDGANTCTCPAGCTLRSSGALYNAGRYQRQEFKARASDCQACALRPQCIRKPETAQRKIAVHLRMPDDPNEPIHRMRAAIDSAHGRQLYSQRIATVEPVFGNLRHNKRLSRFTVRGKDKVSTQWRLFCLVHNIEKVANRVVWA